MNYRTNHLWQSENSPKSTYLSTETISNRLCKLLKMELQFIQNCTTSHLGLDQLNEIIHLYWKLDARIKQNQASDTNFLTRRRKTTYLPNHLLNQRNYDSPHAEPWGTEEWMKAHHQLLLECTHLKAYCEYRLDYNTAGLIEEFRRYHETMFRNPVSLLKTQALPYSVGFFSPPPKHLE